MQSFAQFSVHLVFLCFITAMKNKIPTLKEIAKQLNFSVSTVSRALNDHPSIGLRTKMQVQRLAKELGYEPNPTALYFKQQKTYTIGVVLPNLREEFFSQAINGIEDVAKLHNYSVLIGQSHDNVEQEKQIVAAMKNQRVDGLIVSISKHTKDIAHFEALDRYNIPVVYFDRVPEVNRVNKVSFNFLTGTRQAIEFLISKKHKRIGIINGPVEMKSSRERVSVYKDVLEKNKIKFDDALIVTTDLTEEKTIEAMEKLLALKNPPDAVLAINDWVALDAIHFVHHSKQARKKEICFVSYANLPITNYLQHPPLASVEQYPYKQAQRASEILFQLLENIHAENPIDMGFKNILIEGELVIHKK